MGERGVEKHGAVDRLVVFGGKNMKFTLVSIPEETVFHEVLDKDGGKLDFFAVDIECQEQYSKDPNLFAELYLKPAARVIMEHLDQK